ncbi:TIGR02217 family protein [bacterium]|nr:TIGR02217 family protein [bacterium]
MNFHDVRYPTNLSFGSSGGPERRTEIVTLVNGYEERNSPWQDSRRHYDAGSGMRSLDDLETLIAFFEARRGELFAFRWKDWSDFKTCRPSQAVGPQDQQIGVGDGVTTAFQLVKVYRSGEQSYARVLTKPVAGTVQVAVNGVAQTATSQFVADLATGLVTFNLPPAAGLVVTAGCEFDVPVRFDTDRISTSLATFQAGQIPAVPVIEVRL